MVINILYRLYEDYLMGSRLPQYRSLLQDAISTGYEMHSLISFYDIVRGGGFNTSKKYFVSRHDIDTDVRTAKEMFLIEKELNVKSSFYFRQKTIDINFMKEIEDYGSEASYHYEEIATFAKMNRIKDPRLIMENMNKIRTEFEKNFLLIKRKTNLPMRSVASHGDFVNRALNIANTLILNEEVRAHTGVELEAYDMGYMQYFTARIADCGPPQYYKPTPLIDCIKEKESVIYFLTHPGHWRSSLCCNTEDTISRMFEGINYKLQSK